MTSLRDIFKKTKKTAKETTDKILDANIEENVAKVAEPLSEATVSGISNVGKALKLIFFVLVPITIVVIPIYFFIESFIHSKWCNNTYNNIFENQTALQNLDLREVQELTKIANDYECIFYLYSDEDVRLFDSWGWFDYLERVRFSVMTDEEKEKNKRWYEYSSPKNNIIDKDKEFFKKLKTREKFIITDPNTWIQGPKKSYENKSNKQILNELNQLID